jgi:hypothetical protein
MLGTCVDSLRFRVQGTSLNCLGIRVSRTCIDDSRLRVFLRARRGSIDSTSFQFFVLASVHI